MEIVKKEPEFWFGKDSCSGVIIPRHAIIYELFNKAWKNIETPTIMEKCEYESEKNGPGSNVFKMIITSKLGNLAKIPNNCEYHYIITESPFWSEIVEKSINYAEIKNLYNSQKTLMCTLQIPFDGEYISQTKIIDKSLLGKEFLI